MSAFMFGRKGGVTVFAAAVIIAQLLASVPFAYSQGSSTLTDSDATLSANYYSIGAYLYNSYTGETADSFDCAEMDIGTEFTDSTVTTVSSVINYTKTDSRNIVNGTFSLMPDGLYLLFLTNETGTPCPTYSVTLSANITNSAAATAFGDCLTLSIGGASPSDGIYTLYANYAYRISLSATVSYNSTAVPPNIEAEIIMTGAPTSGTATFTEEGQIVLTRTSTTYNEVIGANDNNPDIPSNDGTGTYHLEDVDPIGGHDAIQVSGNSGGGITEGTGGAGKVDLTLNIPEDKAFVIQFTYSDSNKGQRFYLTIEDYKGRAVVDHEYLTLPKTAGTSYAIADGFGHATLISTLPAANHSQGEKWFQTASGGDSDTKMSFTITNYDNNSYKLESDTVMILVFTDASLVD